ncbi:MAG TPA: DUF86 domain-containing protein [Methanotrichaceae archaeon]|nr:DUF86 domain-containing protein [Methanotrichaceae archaeon]
MKKDDKVFLQHILDAMARIEQYLEGVSIEQFMQNGLIQDGVVRQLEIIGEASRNLSPDLCQSHPEVEWRQIIGLRNRIAHAYFSIDLEIIWEIVHRNLPMLKDKMKQILAEYRS